MRLKLSFKWYFSNEKALRSMGRICHPHTVGHFETRATGAFHFFETPHLFLLSFFLHDSLLGRYHGFFIKKIMGVLWAGQHPQEGRRGRGVGLTYTLNAPSTDTLWYPLGWMHVAYTHKA
jgi:hypothetical protein